MKRVICHILLLLLLFTACASDPADPSVAPPVTEPPPAADSTAAPPADAAPNVKQEQPNDSVAEPAPPAEPDSPVEPNPPVEPDPPPEPYPFTEGAPLCIGGTEAGSVVMLNNTAYLPLDQLSAHLPLTVEPTDDGGVALSFHNRTVWVDDAVCWEVDGVTVSHAVPPVEWTDQWFLPLDAMTAALGLSVLTDPLYPHVYLTDTGEHEPVPTDRQIPILMYHAVAENPRGNDELFVNPSELEKQLQYLAENGFTTITFEDLPRLDEIEKPVMLTFDDGYDDNYDLLYPLLQQYGMKATIFVISGYINFINYLTEAEIKEMSDSGLVSIQSHTDTHPHLDTLDAAALTKEFETSWMVLTRITGKEPFVLCYPSGRHSELARQQAALYYSYGLLMNGSSYVTGADSFLIPRYYISRYTDLDTFAAYVANTK